MLLTPAFILEPDEIINLINSSDEPYTEILKEDLTMTLIS